MEKYLEEGELSEEEIKAGLRIRTLNNEIVLATCGSAFKNKGVQAVLDAVIDFFLLQLKLLLLKASTTKMKRLNVRLLMKHRLLHLHLKLQRTHLWVR